MYQVMDLAFPYSMAATGLRRRLVSIVGAMLLFGSHPTVARAEAGTNQVIDVAVDDPRPVAKAVDSLMSLYGYRITYEDPPFMYAGDLADRYVNGFKDRIPAEGTLSVRFTPSAGMSTPSDMAGLLEKILQAHAIGDRGGRFRVIQDGQDFHVIPSEVKDREGNWVPQASIMNAYYVAEQRTGRHGNVGRDLCCCRLRMRVPAAS
jgi:hypothetical protein